MPKIPPIFISLLTGSMILLASGCTNSTTPPLIESSKEAIKAEYLSPEDLGARKYVFKAKITNDEVAIFRVREYKDGRLIKTREQISKYKNSTFPVVLIHAGALSPNGCVLSFSGSSIQFADLNFQSDMCSSNGYGEIEFKSNGSNEITKFTFEIQIESYKKIKNKIPTLPENSPEREWVYSHHD